MNHLENGNQPIVNKILNKLKNNEPTLTNADQLTDEIMRAISEDASRSKGRVVSMVYRLLVAASVAFLMLFCVEEYIFLDKIKTLESKTAKITKITEQKPALSKLVPFNTGLQSDYIFDLINRGLNDAGRTPLDIRLKMARFNALDIRVLKLHGDFKMRDVLIGKIKGF
jgi:hypothetical protein